MRKAWFALAAALLLVGALATGAAGAPDQRGAEQPSGRRNPAPRPRRQPASWTEPDVPEEAPSFAIYRPGSADRPPAKPAPRMRSEAR